MLYYKNKVSSFTLILILDFSPFWYSSNTCLEYQFPICKHSKVEGVKGQVVCKI